MNFKTAIVMLRALNSVENFWFWATDAPRFWFSELAKWPRFLLDKAEYLGENSVEFVRCFGDVIYNFKKRRCEVLIEPLIKEFSELIFVCLGAYDQSDCRFYLKLMLGISSYGTMKEKLELKYVEGCKDLLLERLDILKSRWRGKIDVEIVEKDDKVVLILSLAKELKVFEKFFV